MGVYIGLGLPRRQMKGSTFGQLLRYPDSYTEKDYTWQIKKQGCSPNTYYCNNCYSFLFFVCDSNYY